MHSTPSATSSLPALTDPAGSLGTPGDVIDVEELLSNPGIPGVDYDPNRIVVWYTNNQDPAVPVASTAPAEGHRASDQANSILRQNKQYEAASDFIAAAYGLGIEQQVYWQQANFAAFSVPDGIDTFALLVELNNNYPGLIDRAYHDRLAHAAWEPTDPDYHNNNQYGGVLWGLKKVNCAEGWDITRGNPEVRVAVVDSGIRLTHEELDGTVLDAMDLTDDIPEGTTLDVKHHDNTVEDLSGHGTMCASAVAAEANGNTIVGVAPNTRIIPIKIHDTGSFPWTDGYAGITAAHLIGARIISCSWGHDGNYDSGELQIIKQVTNGGSLVIGAAGNDNTTASHYPSDFEQVICVGASDPDDNRCDFSNYGPAVDIAAPGQWMKCATKDSDTGYDDFGGGGTSYACPMVSGAAALIWGADPGLTNMEVKDILETTGDPVNGFADGVLRLNVGRALDEVDLIRVYNTTEPSQLIQSGTITVSARTEGEVATVKVKLNGQTLEIKNSAPWTFDIDTSGIDFGRATVEFVASMSDEHASTSFDILVDNSQGAFPVIEGFESLNHEFQALDIKGYDVGLLNSICTIGEIGTDWTIDDVRNNGQSGWSEHTDEASEGTTCMYLGKADTRYDNFDLDVLVSRRINLPEDAAPTMVFHHRFNIERGDQVYDRAWVLVTTDNGLTFTPAKLESGDDALFSGWRGEWEDARIDLSDFMGRQVNLVLFMESDAHQVGQRTNRRSGWWVDDISVATDYNEHVPTLGVVNVPQYGIYGAIPGSPQIVVYCEAAKNIGDYTITLDTVPLGSVNPDDQEFSGSSTPSSVFTIPDTLNNQIAQVVIEYASPDGTPGLAVTVPVYIYNKYCDTNGDGTVNEQDMDGYGEVVGSKTGDPEYVPFYDTNYDGMVTELDAALIGYSFEAGQ